ncbi:hypothetical protein [Streptomyces sp. NPDC001205]
MSEAVLDHVYKLLYGDLGLCGCGTPGDAYALVQQLLDLTPYYDHPAAVEELIGQPGAYHIVLSALTNAELIEHGGAIGGSWLTPKGKWYQAAMRGVEFDDLYSDAANVGIPHADEECTDACWVLPAA